MSKRKLAARGWISFMGLRFAKRFATREEIVFTTRRFFEERGVESFGRLRVEFRMTHRPRRWDWSTLERVGMNGQYRRDTVSVYIPTRANRAQFFYILVHELDHHEWQLFGRGWDDPFKPHGERSHESRAILTGLDWAERLVG